MSVQLYQIVDDTQDMIAMLHPKAPTVTLALCIPSGVFVHLQRATSILAHRIPYYSFVRPLFDFISKERDTIENPLRRIPRNKIRVEYYTVIFQPLKAVFVVAID